MTAKVRSHVTDGLTLKIDKNVKIGEIDHNGAFFALYECFKTLVHDYFTAFLFKQVKNLLLKSDWKQWRLFCFVLFCRLRNSILTILTSLRPNGQSPAKTTTETTTEIRKMSKMTRGVSFSEDQIAEFHEAFLLYDNRGDGKIPAALIGDVIRALGQNPTETEVKKLAHENRADDRVTFEVFLPILQVCLFIILGI